MKKSIYLVSCLLALTLTSTFSQQPIASGTVTLTPSNNQPAQTTLTKFNLDFPGGTPRELVAAIQKATGKPLNAIVPEEFADTKLPPLKMNAVDVSKLFRALEISSMKTVAYVTGTTTDALGGTRSTYQQSQIAYGFRSDGSLSDDTVWYFRVDGSNLPLMYQSKVSRYYSLSPYLDQGLTVDDITTAIQTGWKMQGDTSTPQISFHKETKLLIAVGEPNKLDTIDAVLKALGTPQPKTPPKAIKPVEQSKPAQE